MADLVGAAEGDRPSLSLTADETRAYRELFKEADPDGFGAVSGDVAVKFFEKTKLPPDVLGQIWQIADTENRGFLTPSGFGVVLRLIGHAQSGKTPTASLAIQPAPLPRFGEPMSLSAQTTGTPSSPAAAPGPIRVPPLSPEKVSEYATLFDKSGAQNGILSGVVAKQIFERARLPNEVLGRIWGLADTQGRGGLDVTEFVIAMHLLASYKAGAMRGVPNNLPPGLYEAASRRVPPRANGPARPPSAQGLPASGPFFPQQTGFNQRPQSPITRAQAGTPMSAQSTGDWLISAEDKARFDQVFTSVDKAGRGFIDGAQAIEFFGNARLPEEVLAQIWDLADINSEGQLDRDEFAVAMYLIRQQRGTRDGRGNLPATLPPALLPPSRRKQVIPPSQPTAPTFENAPITQPRSAAEDLFGLDVLAPSTLASAQVPQSTGGTDTGFFASPNSPKAPIQQPPAAAAAQASSMFKPFEPSSTFGRSLGPQPTGSPAPGPRAATSSLNDDLLGDNDATQSSKLTNDSAELGNLSNQVGTLSTQMTQLQGERSQTEQELAQTRHQKQAFETRLAQLRASYEREVAEVKALKDQLATSQADTKRLQQEMAMVEGTYADLQTQHQQLSQALTADQQENAALKQKSQQLNAENERIKPQLEKLKSDARQQKGLVAINRKQLATNADERERLRAEIDGHQKDHADATREIEESSQQMQSFKATIEAHRAELAAAKARAQSSRAEAEAAKAELTKTQETHRDLASTADKTDQSLPVVSPPVTSPAASITSNPFMRRPEPEAAVSPSVDNSTDPRQDHSAFDSIFGPAFGAAAGTGAGSAAITASSAVPPTSFRSGTPSSDMVATPEPEPPELPSTRQITSDELPLRTPMQRQESQTSSVAVAPPASRLSPADTPRAGTPAVAITSPLSQVQTFDGPSHVAAADEEQESIRQAVAGSPSLQPHDIPGAFPSHTPTTEQPAQTAALAAGAGAAATAVAVGAGLATVDHGENATQPDSNFDEYFGGPAHQRTASEQVADFDSAFANMRSAPSANGRPMRPTNEEFPDIREMDDDDDDDTSTEGEAAPLGFEDDFNTRPAAAAAVSEASANALGKQPEPPTTMTDTLQVRPPLGTTGSAASSLPGIEQQQSPPDYKSAVPAENPNHFPLEYKGLLPEREDPTSPDPVTAGGTSHPGPGPSGTPPAYGPEAAQSDKEALQNVASQAAIGTQSAKPAGFDFDSAFAGMGTAHVEEEESDEDGASGFEAERQLAHEFDPSFDSPAQSRPVTVASVTQSPATAHRSVTAATNGTSTTESFSNFGGSAATTLPGQLQPVTSTNASAAPASHDWDALFAPLDSAGGASPGAETPGSMKNIPNNVPDTRTTVDTNTTAQPGRPQPGRAISTGTEHDDPILKRLTAMGWSRAQSLAALEKFDYNLDKAADYLTFQT